MASGSAPAIESAAAIVRDGGVRAYFPRTLQNVVVEESGGGGGMPLEALNKGLYEILCEAALIKRA